MKLEHHRMRKEKKSSYLKIIKCISSSESKAEAQARSNTGQKNRKTSNIIIVLASSY